MVGNGPHNAYAASNRQSERKYASCTTILHPERCVLTSAPG